MAPAQATVLQAERTRTRTTSQTTPSGALRIANRYVDSAAGVSGCSGCSDGTATPLTVGGLGLGDETGAGIPAGTSIEYVITVPKGETYELVYRAVDKLAPVEIPDTAFSAVPNGRTNPVALTLGAGKHTIVLTSPDAASAGWQLDWIRFTRQ